MGKTLSTIAIIQARLNSIRFPNKVMQKINGKPLIEILIERVASAKEVNKIVVATSVNKKNKKLIEFLKRKKISFYQGSENNVLKRYYDAATKNKFKNIIRITGDCPLVDPALIDQYVKIFKEKKVDYLSNICPPTYPDGLDLEIFTYNTLKKAYLKAKNKYDLEHVTPYIQRSDDFKKINITYKKDHSKLRLTIDEKKDLEVIKLVFKKFYPKIIFSFEEILKFVKKKPLKFRINSSIIRNEGAKMTKTQKLWKRAKIIIPGGNMILSKRPELFLPEKWPAYYKKAKGYNIWDLDGKKYSDISLMGVGSNALGYANSEIDNAVIKAINNSNLSTLNCPEEVELCEKLLGLHPWADMARLARTGGEASAMCVRIARAATGKEKIAFCGYHGWHDWYLASNLKNKDNLKSHLMGGLEANGVPSSLKDTAFPFQYNKFDELEKIVKDHDIGTVKMEVSRNFKPKDNFLKKVRNLCNKKNIVLIFDECSSGFRQTFGGLHKIYNVEPDMAWFGKALGNGYAITAIIGKQKVMDSTQNTFMSSTFWSERSGPVAALKTLEIMEKTKSWETLTKIGKSVQKKWQEIARKNNLKIKVTGIPALSAFSLDYDNWLKYKTYITQEMLKKSFLATNALFVSVKHDEKVLNRYFDLLNNFFKDIYKFEKNIGASIDEKLESEVCHSGFQRLN